MTLLSFSCMSGKKYKNNKIPVLRIVLVVHLLSCIQLCDPMNCSTPDSPVLHYLLDFAQTHVHWVGDVIQLSHLCLPLLLLPSFFPSIRAFPTELALRIRWPVYWNFSFSISPSSEYSGLICFRIDWLDLLAVQEILKSLLQHHSLKTSVLQCSAFFMVQITHPYMTTRKTITLAIIDLCWQSNVSAF